MSRVSDLSPLPERLSDLPLRRSADKAVRKAALADDAAGFRKAFGKSVAKARKSLQKRLPEAIWPHSLSQFSHTQPPADLSEGDVDFLTADSQAEALEWLTAADWLTYGPLQSLAAAELLTQQTGELAAEQFALIYTRLVASIDPPDWQPVDLTSVAASRLSTDILLFGLAPLWTAYALADLKPARDICRTAMANLAAMLDEATDTDGLLHGNLQPVAHWLAGNLALCAIVADSFDEPWATARTTGRWQKTLRLIAQQCDHRGPALVPLEETAGPAGTDAAFPLLRVLRTAARLLDEDSEIVKLLKGLQKSTPSSGRPKTKSLKPADSTQSDWAEVALLRDRIDVSGNAISVMWPQDQVRLGVSCLGQRLLTGAWDYAISVNGKASVPAGSWVCTCWFEDNDVAFVELERGSSDGLRHVRQAVLVHNASLALLTDTVTTADRDAEVDFSSRLPAFANPQLSLQTNTVTRELRGNQEFADLRAVPLWLPDDRVHSGSGEFRCDDGVLTMTESGAGGVTLPLLLDWSQVRSTAEADWTRLTVTEDRERLTGHAAAGFRVRMGRLQLLVYRSLRVGQTLRAVLGYNTSSETVYGRVLRSGRIAPLVMVESEVAAEE
ncbi:MAG: hypothetical protein NXI04_29250 [Planctomycetaceae bacterium]|nr:hypothetical protein [Planctomycetaceae bacterium]